MTKTLIVALLILSVGCGKKNITFDVLPKEEKQTTIKQVEPKIEVAEPEELEPIIDIPIIDDVVLFDLDSYEIPPEMQLKLDNIIEDLSVCSNVVLTLKGGCCPIGEVGYNKILGYKRAKAVEAYLKARVSNQCSVYSYGETSLETTDKDYYHLNRRCEIGIE